VQPLSTIQLVLSNEVCCSFCIETRTVLGECSATFRFAVVFV
jgi:hypothetical protein